MDNEGYMCMDQEDFIDMFKPEEKFFIDNNISNPKEY